eukprot:scaffold586_cov155-Amphora_coffeaeformis.AAC.5
MEYDTSDGNEIVNGALRYSKMPYYARLAVEDAEAALKDAKERRLPAEEVHKARETVEAAKKAVLKAKDASTIMSGVDNLKLETGMAQCVADLKRFLPQVPDKELKRLPNETVPVTITAKAGSPASSLENASA